LTPFFNNISDIYIYSGQLDETGVIYSEETIELYSGKFDKNVDIKCARRVFVITFIRYVQS